MDLSTFRTELRKDLDDTDSSAYRWTNDELDRHISRAVTEYSRVCPRDQKSTKATTSSSRDIDISLVSGIGDLVKLYAVEFPIDKFPKAYQRFSYFNSVITLLGDYQGDGTNCYIYWGKIHTLIDGAGTTCSIPEKDLETVQHGAAGYAALAWAQYNINRVNVGGPGVARDVAAFGKHKLALFQAELQRLRRKLRVSRMYAPWQAVNSQTTDWGP